MERDERTYFGFPALDDIPPTIDGRTYEQWIDVYLKAWDALFKARDARAIRELTAQYQHALDNAKLLEGIVALKRDQSDTDAAQHHTILSERGEVSNV